MFNVGSTYKYLIIDAHTNKTVALMYEGFDEVKVLMKGYLDRALFSDKIGCLFGSYNTGLFDNKYKLSLAMEKQIKREGKTLTYYENFNKRTLKEMDILILPKNKYHFFGALLTYLDKVIKDKNLNYVVEYHTTQGSFTDNTNRSLLEIATQGYRGNRLDIMVGMYSTELYVEDEMFTMSTRQSGIIQLGNPNKVLYAITNLSDRRYIDVCLM